MNETKLKTVAQISALLAGTADVAFTTPANEAARRDFISGVLKRFGYSRLANKTRGVLLAYMQRLTVTASASVSPHRPAPSVPLARHQKPRQPHQLCPPLHRRRHCSAVHCRSSRNHRGSAAMWTGSKIRTPWIGMVGLRIGFLPFLIVPKKPR